MTFEPYILVYVAIAVVVIGAVLYFRKNPAALASVESRLTDLVSKQHDTIAAQATVIASPPVQAVINAGPVHTISAPTTLPPAAPTTEYKDGYPYILFGDGNHYYFYDQRNFATVADVEAYKIAVAARDANQAIIDTTHKFGPDPRVVVPPVPKPAPVVADGNVPIQGQ